MAAAERWFAALTSLVALRGENGHAPELSGPNPDRESIGPRGAIPGTSFRLDVVFLLISSPLLPLETLEMLETLETCCGMRGRALAPLG